MVRRAYQEIDESYAKSDTANGFPVQSSLRTQLVRGQQLSPSPRCTMERKTRPRRSPNPRRGEVMGGSEDFTQIFRVISRSFSMFSSSRELPACSAHSQSFFQSSQERKDLWGHSTPSRLEVFDRLSGCYLHSALPCPSASPLHFLQLFRYPLSLLAIPVHSALSAVVSDVQGCPLSR